MSAVADAETEQQVDAIAGMNQELTDAQAERDAAQAEAAELKRKYEPENGVIAEQMYEVTTDHCRSYMHVQILSDEGLLLELLPNDRSNGNVPDHVPFMTGRLTFRPVMNGFKPGMLHLDEHCKVEVYIGDGTDGNSVLVHFDHDGVRFDVVNDCIMGDTPLTITEFTPHSTVTLSTKRQRQKT